jgi:hypothetical protein
VGGEMVYNIIAYPIMWFGHTSLKGFFYIFISTALFKIIITTTIWPFECYFAALLKKREGINKIDWGISYNIFRLKISDGERPQLRIVR